ncbi:MAG: MotA/TolQ/ExbB proton channel family protein [Planctomycetota bacterium]|jgi:biopolymer transport protein ExbB
MSLRSSAGRLAPAAICLAVLVAARGRAAQPDPAATVARAIEQTRRDIDEARKKLLAGRREIATERISLTRRVAELESGLRDRRAAWQAVRGSRDEGDTALHGLRTRSEALGEQIKVVRSLLVELRRNAEAKLDLVDAAHCASDFKEIDRLLDAAARDRRAVPRASSKLLGLVAAHVEEAGRLRRVPGRAVGPDGRELAGTFVKVGAAMSLFAGEGEGAPSGIVRLEHGSTRPHVFPVSGEAAEEVAALARGEQAHEGQVPPGGSDRTWNVPVDLTSGAALRAAKAERSLGQDIAAGGVVMIPIIAIGIVCLAVGVWKLVQLVRVSTDFDAPLGKLVGLIRAGEIDKARSLAGSTSAPLGRLMTEGVDHHRAPKESLEEILHEAIMAEVPRLERFLSFLAVGASVSPLLGLLGTVTGMIHTFTLISVFGAGDPKLLSAGISEALITTQAGLLVAIPLLLAHAFLRRRVNAIADGLEQSATSFTNALKLKTGEPSRPPTEA